MSTQEHLKSASRKPKHLRYDLLGSGGRQVEAWAMQTGGLVKDRQLLARHPAVQPKKHKVSDKPPDQLQRRSMLFHLRFFPILFMAPEALHAEHPAEVRAALLQDTMRASLRDSPGRAPPLRVAPIARNDTY